MSSPSSIMIGSTEVPIPGVTSMEMETNPVPAIIQTSTFHPNTFPEMTLDPHTSPEVALDLHISPEMGFDLHTSPEMDFGDGTSMSNFDIMEAWMSPVSHNTFGIDTEIQMVEPYTPTMPAFTLPCLDPESVPSGAEDAILEMSRKLTFALGAKLICQKKGERIGDFVRRYIDECQKAHDLLESQQVSDFITSLHPGALQSKLIRLRPTTLNEVTSCARDFIRSKEARALTQGSIFGEQTDPFFESMEVEQAKVRREDKRPRRDEQRLNRHNPLALPNPPTLTKTPKEILLTERVSITFRPPPAMKIRIGRKNLIRYCDFHKDHGHDTNKCRELLSEISRALNKGRLSHLVCGAKTEDINKPDRPKKRQEQGGTSRRT